MAAPLSLDKMTERRISEVAQDWASTLSGDGAVDIDDLEQDLRFRCWGYTSSRKHSPGIKSIRGWAKEAMREYGYHGANIAFLKPKIPMRGIQFNGIANINDEESLDYLYFHYGLQRENESIQGGQERHQYIFWKIVEDDSFLMGKFDDIAKTSGGFQYEELAELWGMKHYEEAKRYAQVYLRKRLEEIDSGGAVYHLKMSLGLLATLPKHYKYEYDSSKQNRQTQRLLS